VTRMQEWKSRYRAACPFPHIVLESFLANDRVERAAQAFPSLDELPWYVYDNAFERKFAYDKPADMPQTLCDLLWELNSLSFVAFLEELTGISDLVADDSFRGGGLHCVARGGRIDVHADFNIHPVTGLHRRLNAILFLNKDWRPEYGGELELWNRDMSMCVERILPTFNRMVIFDVTDTSFHGHPEPLRTPEGVLRKSMAWYYYTADRPADQKAPAHSTLYQRRPGDPDDPVIEQLRQRRAVRRLAELQLGLCKLPVK
jgi:2OG-Fe(II) oxygenase superfamily